MIELLKRRYSSRNYSEEMIPEESINYILKCMLMSPSGKRSNPWEFVLIDDLDLIKKLALSKSSGAQFVTKAQNLIVVIGHEEISDTWIEDAAVTLTLGHLAATHLNLGSCWIQSRNRKNADMSSEVYVKNLLQIPDKLRVLGMLSLGHPLDQKQNENPLQVEKISLNTYKSPYTLKV